MGGWCRTAKAPRWQPAVPRRTGRAPPEWRAVQREDGGGHLRGPGGGQALGDLRGQPRPTSARPVPQACRSSSSPPAPRRLPGCAQTCASSCQTYSGSNSAITSVAQLRSRSGGPSRRSPRAAAQSWRPGRRGFGTAPARRPASPVLAHGGAERVGQRCAESGWREADDVVAAQLGHQGAPHRVGFRISVYRTLSCSRSWQSWLARRHELTAAWPTMAACSLLRCPPRPRRGGAGGCRDERSGR